jgi:hypothetical protein
VALPANISLGWKGLPGTNALAYYEKLYLMTVKSFITLASRKNTLTSFKGLFTRPISEDNFALSVVFCFNMVVFLFYKKALANANSDSCVNQPLGIRQHQLPDSVTIAQCY